jgi:hypothetical protein
LIDTQSQKTTRGQGKAIDDEDNYEGAINVALQKLFGTEKLKATTSKPSPASAAARDDDGDKLTNDVDRCPDKPETFNGFEDSDGCPDKKPRTTKKPNAASKQQPKTDDTEREPASHQRPCAAGRRLHLWRVWWRRERQ